MLAWFWMTPIVYYYGGVAKRLGNASGVLLLNPMTSIIIMFQRTIYNRTVVNIDGTPTAVLPSESIWWYLRNVSIVLAVSLLLLWGAFAMFARLEDNFAEEM